MKSQLLALSVLLWAAAVSYSFTLPARQDDEASELALLMRQMYTDSEQIRAAVLLKQLPADFREKFKAIHTATPTDAGVRDANFKVLSEAFLTQLDKVYAGKAGKNQVENFNKMVNTCVACHSSYCPGPIGRIKKLTIAKRR
jgi:cytochrome c556